MKKIFLTVVISIIAIVNIMAYDFEIGGIYYEINYEDPNTVSVTSCFEDDGYDEGECWGCWWGDMHFPAYQGGVYTGNVNIPDTVIYDGTTYTVSRIGEGAFAGCEELTSVTIPNTVTVISMKAFSDCLGLTSITIPNSVVEIGDWAFDGCLGMETVFIPASVVQLGEGAFGWDSNLQEIIVSVDNPNYCSVDGVVFNKDKSTIIQFPAGRGGSYTVPNSVKRIGSEAFKGCTNIESIILPNTVEKIGFLAFGHCSATSITLPASLTSIGAWTFFCSAVRNINIPNTVTYIGEHAFGFSGLESIILPKSLVTIEDHAFMDCMFTEISIPDSVKTIGFCAFVNNNNLERITLGKSVNYIDEGAFRGVSSDGNLTRITCLNPTPPIAVKGGFDNSFDEATFSECTLYVPSESIELYKSADVWKEFTHIEATVDEPVILSDKCGDNLTWELSEEGTLSISGTGHMYDYTYSPDYVGDGVELSPWYDYRDKITKVTIGDSVTNIGSSAFYECINMESIEIPNSVTGIGCWAFEYCTGLTTITLPSSLTNIDSDTFLYCSSLSSVTIPSTVTNIGTCAFMGCSGLESLDIPASVTYIGNYAFCGCSSLADIYCHVEQPIAIESSVFSTVPYSDCTLHVPSASVELYKVTEIWGEFAHIESINTVVASGTCGDNLTWTLDDEGLLTIEGTGDMYDYDFSYETYIPNTPWYNYRRYINSVSIGNSVTTIGNCAFNNCSSLTSFVIPNSVTSIGQSAFQDCSGLTSVVIPNSVTSIGENAFYYCSGLTSVVIPNSVTSIGVFAFYYCSHLTSVVIPNSVTSIGEGTFSYCSGLTSVEIPNSVTSIGIDAFYGCSGLTSVVIPNSVTSIGIGAFANCSGLTSVVIGNSVTSIGDYAFSGLSLEIVYNFAEVPQTINDYVFDGHYGTLYVPAGSVAAYQNADYWKEFTIKPIVNVVVSGTCGDNLTWTLDEGLLTIEGTGDMYDYYDLGTAPWDSYRSKIKSLSIGNSVTRIGHATFYNCYSLTSVVIPNSVTSIGSWAFAYSSDLTSVVIGNSVTSIDDYAFSGCTNLETVHNLAEVPQTIDSSVFNGHYGTLYVPAGSVAAYQSADEWKEFTIVGVQNGDVNLDQKVNVTDAVEIVNNVVGEASERFEEAWSDVNSDNQYTIADAMAVVNIIHGEDIGASYAMNHAPMANNDHLSLYSTDSSSMTLAMDNMQLYSSFQFNVNLPEGITLENVTLNQNRCKDFSVLFRETGENKYTVAVFNFGNEPFATGSGALLDMSVSGSGDLNEAAVSNIHFSTTRAVDVQFDDMMLSEATGINDVNDNVDEYGHNIYDLSGRRLESVKKGVNIVNGKKIVVR